MCSLSLSSKESVSVKNVSIYFQYSKCRELIHISKSSLKYTQALKVQRLRLLKTSALRKPYSFFLINKIQTAFQKKKFLNVEVPKKGYDQDKCLILVPIRDLHM